mgnify:CR=1 FL=1
MPPKRKYCPSWIYDCVVADVCGHFLNRRGDLVYLSDIYVKGLSSHYIELSEEELVRSAEEVIQFLIRVGDGDALDLLSNFSFYSFYYVSKVQKRSFRGVLSWGVFSDNSRSYTGVFTLKRLKAYYYEQRSGANKIGCLGWKLGNQPEAEFLRVLANKF